MKSRSQPRIWPADRPLPYRSVWHMSSVEHQSHWSVNVLMKPSVILFQWQHSMWFCMHWAGCWIAVVEWLEVQFRWCHILSTLIQSTRLCMICKAVEQLQWIMSNLFNVTCWIPLVMLWFRQSQSWLGEFRHLSLAWVRKIFTKDKNNDHCELFEMTLWLSTCSSLLTSLQSSWLNLKSCFFYYAAPKWGVPLSRIWRDTI